MQVALGGSSRTNAVERAVTDKKVVLCVLCFLLNLHFKVNEDRKLAIQACIVRVMKSRKSATHTQLVLEVRSPLWSLFFVVIQRSGHSAACGPLSSQTANDQEAN